VGCQQTHSGPTPFPLIHFYSNISFVCVCGCVLLLFPLPFSFPFPRSSWRPARLVGFPPINSSLAYATQVRHIKFYFQRVGNFYSFSFSPWSFCYEQATRAVFYQAHQTHLGIWFRVLPTVTSFRISVSQPFYFGRSLVAFLFFSLKPTAIKVLSV
jgi:hypothetical protein